MSSVPGRCHQVAYGLVTISAFLLSYALSARTPVFFFFLFRNHSGAIQNVVCDFAFGYLGNNCLCVLLYVFYRGVQIPFIFSKFSSLSTFALVLLAPFSWRCLCAGRLHYPVSEALLV